jgi:C1A family cysteine protease
MKFARIGIILLLLIISVGAVSAAEEINNNTLSNDNTIGTGDVALDDEPTPLQSIQNGEYGVNEVNNTFTDLNNIINTTAENTLEIGKNYKFNNETDTDMLRLSRDNFVINGNNFVIDGNNQSSILYIRGNNITINNLIFANAKENKFGGAVIISGGSVTLNNVTFINNVAVNSGAAMQVIGGVVNCFNCNFIDSYSSETSSIYIVNGTVNIRYSNFTSRYFNKWGSIFADGKYGLSTLLVDNCIFTNISSRYTPAIFADTSDIIINNTQFINLKANETAGAVGIRTCGLTIVENCLFVNTSSVKNAGALFIDPLGENGNPRLKIADVSNLTFINASSGYGGAFVQLGGLLSLKDSTFTNCSAAYGGGAVYLSYATTKITNCKFNSNKVATQNNYPTYGGAIYFDYDELFISNSEFNNNDAPIASGILIYDSEYHLDNITFNNNNNPIYTYFDKNASTIGKIYGNDEISDDDLNNTYYVSVVVGEGMNINLTTNNIDLTILPTKFDLREIGWLTPVRDQGNMGSCWAFGAIAALESALLKNTGIPYDFSENNMQDSMVVYSRYGTTYLESALETVAAAYLLNWFGAFPQEYDLYDELGKLSPLIYTNQTIHIQDFVFIDGRNISIPGDPVLKRAILKYGALAVLYCADQTPEHYNATSGAFYSLDGNPNHAVGLVGWDDNYPKENFATTPEGDGAWIIKNSWGAQYGDGGYMYISYYDRTLCRNDDLLEQAVGYIVENTLPYNKNYQYDFTGIDHFMMYNQSDELYGTSITNVNNFVSIDDDLIAAVGTYFNQSGMDYTVKIAVNDVVVYTQSGISPYRGYHTIKLNRYVPIKKDDKFSIYVTSAAVGVSVPVRAHYETGVSLTDMNGTWTDLYQKSNQIACIKAYTLMDDTAITGNENISVDYDGGKYFSVNVTTADGHGVAGASVEFKINGQSTTVSTDNSGIAKIKITQLPGSYFVTTTYNGKTYKNSVIVKQVLKTSKVTVKKTAKKFTLKATLKINGKLVKGKLITFKFNGKTYKVKTNAKGIAQKTLNKNVIKKLKKGKTYTVKVTYLKDTIKTTVKVK